MCRSLLLVSALISLSVAYDNGLGATPAMGYNTWNDFRCDNINADNIKKVADKMADLGLNKIGYEYVNIDDCWATGRDPVTGEVIPDKTAFPDGMKAVADYVHSKGFKFGIYSDRGNLTCAGRPGSWGFETVDANTYAKWGVDYLKEDSCYAPGDHDFAFMQYSTMRDALNKTGRPIYFSLCGWNDWYAPAGWGIANSWRISGDVNDWNSVWFSISLNSRLAGYARPGGWNDPDMLVGSTPTAAVHLTPDQSRSQFSMWSIMAAPLLIGSNILNLSDYDAETYTNAEVIAIDQDPLGVQGTIQQQNCPLDATSIPDCHQIWSKRLSNGDIAMAFLNWGNATTITCDAHCLAVAGFSNGASVRDVWAHKNLGNLNSISSDVAANGASVVFRLSAPKAVSAAEARHRIAESLVYDSALL